MLAEKNPYIGSAYQHLQVISQDEEKRMEYEAWKQSNGGKPEEKLREKHA